jgi:HK97 family phage major capsid protein
LFRFWTNGVETMTLQEKREKRDQLKKDLRALLSGVEERRSAGKEAWPAEETAKADKIKAELVPLNVAIESEERSAELEGYLLDEEEKRASQDGRPNLKDEVPFQPGREFGQMFGDRSEARAWQAKEEKRSMGLAAWSRGQFADQHVTEEHRAAAKEIGLDLNARAIEFRGWSAEQTTEARTALAARGWGESAVNALRDRFATMPVERRAIAYGQTEKDSFIPSSFQTAYEIAFHGMGGVMDLVDLIVTDTSDSLPFPFVDDYGNEGARVGAGDASDQDAQTVKAPKLQVIEFQSKYMKIHKSLLANSPMMWVSMLGAVAGERLRKAMERELALGPLATADRFRGYVASAPVAFRQAVAGTYTYAETRKLKMSVIEEHRVNGTYVVNNEQLGLLDALLDTTGRPMFDPDTGRLCGSPYRVNNYVQAQTGSATGDKMLFYGNLKSIKMRLMNVTRLEKLVELFATTHQAAFLAYRGGDAELLRGTNAANAPLKAMDRPA